MIGGIIVFIILVCLLYLLYRLIKKFVLPLL